MVQPLEKVAVSARSNKPENTDFLVSLHIVNEEPIRLYVAFTNSLVFARQLVVTVFLVKWPVVK